MKITVAAVLVLVISAPIAGAQPSGGNIAGRVVDPQGSAVPGASVTAKNPATGFVRTETTDNAGLYRLLALPVGAYEMTVEEPGFTATGRKGVEVAVTQTVTIDFRLRIAGVTEDVTVTARRPLTDTTASSVGGIVDPRRVQDLPINGRQFANLAATLPGVGLGFHSDPTKGTNYAPLVNGGAGRNINYQVDGGDNNDDTVGGLLQQYPLEAIEEFRFETQRFKAEDGRSNGGVMNIVTKGGTNQYQTTLFELARDKSMNALTESEKLAGLAAGKEPRKGDYGRNQFGGSFGGPVRLDRVHFFLALERTQQDTTQTVNTKGLFPTLDGVYPTLLRENLGTVKISANVNPSQYLTVRYGRNTNSFPFNASPTTTADNWADADNRFNSANVSHNWVLGGTKLNEAVFQYSNYHDHIGARTDAINQSFTNTVATGSSLSAPQTTEQVKYQIRDDFSWSVTGHGGLGHTLKAGVNFIDEPRLFIENTAGKGITAYALGTTALSPVFSVTINGGDGSANIPTKQYGFYVQDDWRLGARFTLNAGVRYDLVTGLNFDQSRNPNFVKIQEAAKAGKLSGIVGLENFGLDPQADRNNIQPRVGGAYDVTGSGRTMVRAGWGIYTDFGYTNSNVLQAALDASGSRFGSTFSVSDPKGIKNPDGTLFQVGQSLDNIASQNTVAAGTPPLLGFWVDPRLQQPYQLQTNVGWSHEITSDIVLALDYVNSLGRDLNYKPRLNQIVAGTAPTGPHRISMLLSSNLSPNNSLNRPALSRGKSRYNALIFSGRRRFARGFDFTASYMLSQALSTIGSASDELNTANMQDPNNPFDNPAQFGPNVTTDARHRINLSAVVQLPYGVQVAPFFLYRSALPIFLIDPRDPNKDGDKVDMSAEAFAVVSTDPATGKATIKSIGPCETVNCGRGWGQSQMNLRVSKVFGVRRVKVEAIGEVFNLFNALNPSNIAGGVSGNRSVVLANGAADPTLLQPTSFSGDSQRPEQRVGQIGLRFSF